MIYGNSNANEKNSLNNSPNKETRFRKGLLILTTNCRLIEKHVLKETSSDPCQMQCCAREQNLCLFQTSKQRQTAEFAPLEYGLLESVEAPCHIIYSTKNKKLNKNIRISEPVENLTC